MTKESKLVIQERLEKDRAQLQLECGQLLFEQKKLLHKINHSKEQIEQRFSGEIKQREAKITLIDFKIEQLDLLAIGSEVIEKEIEALVEVKVGTSWEEIMGTQSIIIKDGFVVRIENE